MYKYIKPSLQFQDKQICKDYKDAMTMDISEIKYHMIIWRLNTIEESLSFAKHGVAHTTFVLETNCLASKCHVARLSPNSTKRCWVMQDITRTSCYAKVGIGKHGTPIPTYKGLKKEFTPPPMWSMIFGFAMTTSSVV